MPLTVASVIGFIPLNIWRPLKKFLTKEELVICDLPFKISTKYTPALLMVLMCLSFANQFVRNVEIDCTSGGGGGGGGGAGYGTRDRTSSDQELNDYCWNHDTFLVVKALQPEMRGLVSYPGVSGYNKDRDKVVRQHYYKFVWFILGIMIVLSFLPFFFWKVKGMAKIKPLLDTNANLDDSETDQRVSYFVETIGFNNGFASFYLGCKLFAMMTPVLEFYFLCAVPGYLFKSYGLDVITAFMSDSWPSPMDALFPKMAKCEWIKYGYGGDMEVRSAQCQLPMNNLTQWSFFVFWWWLPFVFILNLVSFIRLITLTLPHCRQIKYKNFVQVACREDVEKARTYTVQLKGIVETKKLKRKDVISVNMQFGDLVLLSFIKRNLADWQFREFVRKLVVTKNEVLQLRAVPAHCNLDPEIDEKPSQMQQNIQMGFILPPGITPYQAPSAPTPPYETTSENVSSTDDERKHSTCNSETGLITPTEMNDLSIAIGAPVKIERERERSPKKNSGSSSKTSSSQCKKPPPKKARPPPPGFALPRYQKKNKDIDDEEWD